MPPNFNAFMNWLNIAYILYHIHFFIIYNNTPIKITFFFSNKKSIMIPCESCEIISISKSNSNCRNNRIFNPLQHIALCRKCRNSNTLYSKTICKDKFLLSDDDLQHLRYLYFPNKCNKTLFFLKDNIDELVLDKYKTVDKLEETQNKRKMISLNKKTKLEKKKENRMHIIKEEFRNHKLAFHYFGDCFSYINYGKPELEVVVQNELDKSEKIIKKQNRLLKKLTKKNITLNESIGEYKKYISGEIKMKTVIKAMELDHFFRTQTDYEMLVPTYGDNQAKNIALRNYVKHNKQKNIPKQIKQKTLSLFD